MVLKIHVFYGVQYMGNETTLDDIARVPDGAYVKMNGKWFIMDHNSLLPMMKPYDLPPEIKAQLAILGESA